MNFQKEVKDKTPMETKTALLKIFFPRKTGIGQETFHT
jgi:hypothetical protein